MVTKRFLAAAALIAAVSPAATFAGPAKAADPGLLAALHTIKHDADAVAAGQYSGKALQSPAREIALAWDKAATALGRSGSAIVETKMANASISAFERDWQSAKNIRGEAKDVSSSVADLTEAVASGG